MNELNEMVGITITGIKGLEKHSGEVVISTSQGHLRFFHEQDCCETVLLEDFEDDGVVGGVVLSAEEVCSQDNPPDEHRSEWDDSFTWTFYKIETTKGGLWMRWLGESNGYYSESVDMEFTPL